MFAFAIFDTTTGRVVAARDRLGIKPFVWAQTQAGFAFCSEQRALVRAGFVDGSPDPGGIGGFLAKGYAANGRSLLQGVRHLMPGHALTWQDERLQESTWFEPRVSSRTTLAIAENAQRELDEVATDAV